MMRKTLLVFQFTIACIFISGVLIIRAELQYLAARDIGFNPHQVLVARYGQLQTQFQYPFVKDVLLREPGVQSVSYCSEGGMLKDKFVMSLTIDGVSYQPHYLCVDTAYFSVMGAHIINGKSFSSIDSGRNIVINRALAEIAHIRDVKDGKEVWVFNKQARVIGIVEDLNLYGFENAIGPMAFTINGFTMKPYLLIKIGATDVPGTLAAIQRDWKGIEPGYPLRYQFLDQSFEQLYNGYERLGSIFRLFSLCALVLTFSGLFSISVLITLQKAKEITIRKVLGATKYTILVLLNKNFVCLVFIANFLACPVSLYLSRKWLDQFAYRIDISPFPFCVALAASLLLAMATVSLQSLKVVSRNPADGLRQE